LDYINGLNDKQKEAVLHDKGPLLILAGAGSGKTRVLTHRIAYLINEKLVRPYNILAITFTNKAAKEMKERLKVLMEDVVDSIWINTFHSVCLRILRREIEKIGYEKNFVIFDSADQKTLIKDCLKELDINDKDFPVKQVIHSIGSAKDELIDVKKFEKLYQSDYKMSKIASIYSLYQKKLKQNNALDFDDIIINVIKLFNENPDVLSYYQNKFQYVLVDEYQDTNTAQYTLISMLSRLNRNLCVVGDDDQSIYGWRGANIRNILDFEVEFPDCKTIKLEQNYRSTSIILEAANSVIKNNIGRKSKKLWTNIEGGENISVFQGSSEREEAYFIASEIKKLYSENSKKYNDFAILYRMNAQSRVVEEAFMREGIPYKIFGGLKFYDRKEIKDLIAYLRLIQNSSDNISLKRIINVPKRGIGNTTIENIEKNSSNMEVSMYTIISSIDDVPELARASTKLKDFYNMINDLKELREKVDLLDFIKEVISRTLLLEEYEKENTPEARTRIENVEELLSGVKEFELRFQEESTLESYLEQISLVSDLDNYEEENDNVVLMTLHSAKGLEFPVVYMVGMEDGIFPGFRSMAEESELEEERRLCYVGITRAREKLYMTSAYERTLFGNTSYNKVSRFLKEIPVELINDHKKKENKKEKKEKKDNIKKNNMILFNNVIKRVEDYKAMSRTTAGSNSKYEIGEKVTHKKFGKGIITKIDGKNNECKLEIQFENIGMKRLVAEFANLIRE
jgi:DNA helicase II / ATP-dependent DNA helicase PcrA